MREGGLMGHPSAPRHDQAEPGRGMASTGAQADSDKPGQQSTDALCSKLTQLLEKGAQGSRLQCNGRPAARMLSVDDVDSLPAETLFSDGAPLCPGPTLPLIKPADTSAFQTSSRPSGSDKDSDTHIGRDALAAHLGDAEAASATQASRLHGNAAFVPEDVARPDDAGKHSVQDAQPAGQHRVRRCRATDVLDWGRKQSRKPSQHCLKLAAKVRADRLDAVAAGRSAACPGSGSKKHEHGAPSSAQLGNAGFSDVYEKTAAEPHHSAVVSKTFQEVNVPAPCGVRWTTDTLLPCASPLLGDQFLRERGLPSLELVQHLPRPCPWFGLQQPAACYAPFAIDAAAAAAPSANDVEAQPSAPLLEAAASMSPASAVPCGDEHEACVQAATAPFGELLEPGAHEASAPAADSPCVDCSLAPSASALSQIPVADSDHASAQDVQVRACGPVPWLAPA